MAKNNENAWKLGCIVLIIIVIILSTILVITTLKNTDKTEKESVAANEEKDNIFRHIRINEDLDTDGKVENLENVRWHNARITQMDDEMEVSIMLDSENREEAIPAKTLEVKLLDKQGKVIATKEAQMEEIPSNKGYTDVELEFKINDYTIIHDIQIKAK